MIIEPLVDAHPSSLLPSNPPPNPLSLLKPVSQSLKSPPNGLPSFNNPNELKLRFLNFPAPKVESRGDISNRKGNRVLRFTTASVLAETVTPTGSSKGIITRPESQLDPKGRGCFPVLAIPYGAYHAFGERLTNDLREMEARAEDGAIALVKSRMMVPIIALYWSVRRDELDLISLGHGIVPRPPIEEREEQEIAIQSFSRNS